MNMSLSVNDEQVVDNVLADKLADRGNIEAHYDRRAVQIISYFKLYFKSSNYYLLTSALI